MILSIVKERLEMLKKDEKLHYEWAKFESGSLILKNLKENKEEVEGYLIRDLGKDKVEKISFNPFSPEEFNPNKFLIIHNSRTDI